MNKPIGLSILLAIVVTVGLWNGSSRGRWGNAGQLDTAAAQVAQMPLRLGDWDGTDVVSDDPESFARAGVKAYCLRQYIHRRTGAAVSVLLVCGRPGPVAVHTPDVCYGGAGFDVSGANERRLVTTTESFWQNRFRMTGVALPRQLDVHWAWRTNGDWLAPDYPRWAFARTPFLYKLYVVNESLPPAPPDAGVEFLRQCLPELSAALSLVSA